MSVTRPFLNYYGGKWNLAEWIIGHFPEHKNYVEVFGGGLSVLMQKPPAKLEVINDKENRIVNVYRQVRDNPEELKRLVEMTPYSRTEYRYCQDESENPLEDARRTICALAFGVGHSLSDRTTGFRNSKTSNATPSKSFRTYAEDFDQFHGRIKNCIIENLDWKDVLEKYDNEETLFYLDPPYVHSTRKFKRGYTHEMSNEDHCALVKVIQNLKGKVVLSGYKNEIYTKLPWENYSCEAQTQNASSAIETLWLCPKTINQQKQVSFAI